MAARGGGCEPYAVGGDFRAAPQERTRLDYPPCRLKHAPDALLIIVAEAVDLGEPAADCRGCVNRQHRTQASLPTFFRGAEQHLGITQAPVGSQREAAADEFGFGRI